MSALLFNLYYRDRLVKKNVDGEEVRRFMAKLSREETRYVRLEHIKEREEDER